MVEYDRTLVIRKLVGDPMDHPYRDFMKKINESNRLHYLLEEDRTFGIWIGAKGTPPPVAVVDERLLNVDPEGPIKLDVELPSCGKVDPRYRLVIQSIGGCDIGIGYERSWGFR